jgi:tetratricopeptide (TPR) repeat protein
VLGERDSDPAWLNAALNSYRLATGVYTREAWPSDWARMQRNCGAVLSLQGERTGDTASLREAVDHYRAALEEYTRQESPVDVAVTQSNLGQALRVLGERDKDRDLLAEAAEACRAALAIYTLDATPLEWAMASTNLANALTALDEVATVEEAVSIYRRAVAALEGPARLQQRAIARYNLKRAEQRLAELRQSPSDRRQ